MSTLQGDPVELPVAQSSFAYQVGDLVEITRASGTHQARLSELLTESKSSSPLWLVELTQNETDTQATCVISEQVEENDLRKILESQDSESVNLVSSSDADESSSVMTKKRVSFSDDAKKGPPLTQRRPSSLRSRPGQRKGRSGRTPPPPQKNRGRKRKVTRGSAARGNSKMSKKSKTSSSDEPVTKVPMKTGTLFMYGGPNRRAEFVPHV